MLYINAHSDLSIHTKIHKHGKCVDVFLFQIYKIKEDLFMKLKKRIAAMGAAVMMMLFSSVMVANAEEPDFVLDSVCKESKTDTEMYHPLTDSPEYLFSSDGISTRSNERPTSIWNFENNSLYYFDGSATYTDLYTEKLFTGTTGMGLYVKNENNSAVTVKVYKNTATVLTDTVVFSFSVPANTTVYKTTGTLSSSKKYYVKFSCPCNVSGYIAG